MLEFYMSQGSACCRKVHLVLHEKGLDWTNHVFDPRRGDQLAPPYRRINPNAERQERQRQAIEMGLDAPAIPATMRRFDKLLGDMRLNGLWEENRPRVSDWFARIQARPSYQKAIVENASPKVAQLMAENGRTAWPRLKTML